MHRFKKATSLKTQAASHKSQVMLEFGLDTAANALLLLCFHST
jgi:hypothetical protein